MNSKDQNYKANIKIIASRLLSSAKHNVLSCLGKSNVSYCLRRQLSLQTFICVISPILLKKRNKTHMSMFGYVQTDSIHSVSSLAYVLGGERMYICNICECTYMHVKARGQHLVSYAQSLRLWDLLSYGSWSSIQLSSRNLLDSTSSSLGFQTCVIVLILTWVLGIKLRSSRVCCKRFTYGTTSPALLLILHSLALHASLGNHHSQSCDIKSVRSRANSWRMILK